MSGVLRSGEDGRERNLPMWMGQVPPPPDAIEQGLHQITPFVGYQWWASIPVAGGNLHIANGPVFGLTFLVPTMDVSRLEINFMRQETALDIRSDAGTTKLFSLSVDDFHIGLQTEMWPGRVRPFVGVTVGGTLFEPHGRSETELRISMALEGGVKVILTRSTGVRLQGRLTTTFGTRDTPDVCRPGICPSGFGGILHGDVDVGFVWFP
jgi:hypothetical protein